MLDNEVLDISSTDIRRLIKKKKPVSDMLDGRILKYIIENGLYA